MNKYLLLFEDCRIVEGYLNTLIYDLNRPANSNAIPKSLVHFINKCQKEKLNDVLVQIKSKEERIIAKEYVDFLLKNEFAFMADDHVKEHIGKLPMKMERPELVYNSILCVNNNVVANIVGLIAQLDALLCINLELRCENISKSNFLKLIESFSDSMLETVVIRIKDAIYLEEEFLNKIILDEPRIKEISVFGCPKEKEFGALKYLTKEIDLIEDCGFIDQTNFMINQAFFTEGQSCNTCLNKKLSIDFDGRIKNCPSSSKSFGNIKDEVLLSSIINKLSFKGKWDITKDQVEVCRDCENRYMCLDCRVFTDNPNNCYSRPSRCNYNPYIGKWKGEEGYKSLVESGVVSDENGFKINHEKIAKINAELWEE